MRLDVRSVVLAAVVAGAVPAPPAGAAGWSAPTTLPGSDGRLALFATYGGASTPAIGVAGPLALFPGTPQVPVAVAPSLAAAPVTLPHGLAAPVAVSPGGTLLAVGGPRGPLDYFSGEGTRARVRVGIGPVRGPLRLVATRGLVATKALAAAVNDRGDAVVVLGRCSTKGCSHRDVLAVFRTRGRPFGRPVRLGAFGSTSIAGGPIAAAAMDARGDALVAWTERGRPGRQAIRVRMRRADGRLLRTRTAGTALPRPTLALTMTPGGAGTVAWWSQSHGTGRPFVARSRVMDTRGTLHGLDELGRGAGVPVGGARLRAVVGPDGSTTIAWTGIATAHRIVRVVRLHRDVAQSFAFSRPGIDAQLADLAADAAGDVLAIFTTHAPSAPTTASAAILRAGAAAFDAPQVVLAGSGATGSLAGAIAAPDRAVVAGGPPFAIDAHAPPVQITQLG